MILVADTDVIVSTPGVPNFSVTLPARPNVVVAPVAGPRGAAGAAGGSYSYTQPTPAATWTITHNLGRYPVFNLFTAADPTEPVYTDITYPDNNTAVVEWPTAVAGRAEA